MKLSDAVTRVIAKYGTTRKAGDALDMDYTYLARLATGQKTNPREEQLAKLGLKRVVAYEFIGEEPPPVDSPGPGYRDEIKAVYIDGLKHQPCEGCIAADDATGRTCDAIHDVQAQNCVTDNIIWVKK